MSCNVKSGESTSKYFVANILFDLMGVWISRVGKRYLAVSF